MPIDSTDIELLRSRIDHIDDQIFDLIASRLKICRQIGEIKKSLDLPVYQQDRFLQMTRKRNLWAKENNLSEEDINNILKAIHEASVNLQKQN